MDDKWKEFEQRKDDISERIRDIGGRFRISGVKYAIGSGDFSKCKWELFRVIDDIDSLESDIGEHIVKSGFKLDGK